ncbi:MAG: DolP-mannose mannosyltransferase, partial [Candidatus Abyssubacteria bacterium]|nr:DolP-mannose mannosyltransferase [Candidatus Abyssubacteria bacterium]
MPFKKFIIPLLLFLLVSLVYSQYGFYGKLLRDDAMFLYGGQRLADGVPPYLGIFDVKGPIMPMVTGLGVIISKWVGGDDVYTVRLLFLFISSLAVVVTYLLGKSLFQSQRVGLFAAMTFLGFFDFAREAASGPRAKTLVVLFGVLSLLLTSRKRWFWAGLFGALSALTWQPSGIFLLVTLILATAQPRKERFLAISSSLAGIGLPTAIIVLYFYSQGALYELLDGILLFHFLYRDMAQFPLSFHAWLPLRAIFVSFRMMTIPIAIGFVMIFYFYFWRRSLHVSLKDTLTKDEFSPILLSFLPLAIWSALDFQDACDFYIFLPYIALGFARFLDIAVNGIEGHFGKPGHSWAPRFAALTICATLIGSAVLDIR